MDQQSEKTVVGKQLYGAICWASATALATFGVWYFADPWLIEHFGSGAPWWVYALLCLQLVAGVAQMVARDAALRRAVAQEDPATLPGQVPPLASDTDRPVAGSDFLPS